MTSVANDPIAQIVFGDGCETGGPNACMHAETGNLTFASPNPTDYIRYVELDVIGHEYTHAVYASRAGQNMDLYWGEEGGLMEATSDLFGELIEARAQRKLGNPLMLDENVNPAVDGWMTVRNMCTPSAHPTEPGRDVWDLSINAIPEDAHPAAGPINRVHCILSRGLLTYTGTALEPGLESQIVRQGFAGLGSIAVGNLWYMALGYMRALPLPRSFSDAREAMLYAASFYYGEHSQEYKAVEDAYAVIQKGAPADRKGPQITLVNNLVGTPFANQVTDPSKAALRIPGEKLIVNATDENGVASVRFLQPYYLGTCGPRDVTDTSAPFEFTVPNWPGGCDIQVLATDTRKNETQDRFTLVVDSTPPNVSIWDPQPNCAGDCSGYRTKRVYQIVASDPGGLQSVNLTVDGQPIGSLTGPWGFGEVVARDFVVDYASLAATQPLVETHVVVATATDRSGNTSTTSKTYSLDLTPPAITSGPTIVESKSVDGQVTIDFCAQDLSGVQSVALSVDNLAASPIFDAAPLPGGNGCWTLRQPDLKMGTHAFTLALKDRWGNVATVSKSQTVYCLDPRLYNLSATAESTGRATVNILYAAQRGMKSITVKTYQNTVCGGPAATQSTYTPGSTHDTYTTFKALVDGLTVGATYRVGVQLTGNNDNTEYGCSLPFTVPPPQQPPPPPPPKTCNSQVHEGGNAPETHVIQLSAPSGTTALSFNTYLVPDNIVVTYQGSVLYQTGCVGTQSIGYGCYYGGLCCDGFGTCSMPITYSGTSSQMTVSVNPNCSGLPNTDWTFSLKCP